MKSAFSINFHANFFALKSEKTFFFQSRSTFVALFMAEIRRNLGMDLKGARDSRNKIWLRKEITRQIRGQTDRQTDGRKIT